MRILIYKRTHVGDPDTKRQFGHQGCMGQVRGYAFDAVIGVGGVSKWPMQEGIAKKINWVGQHPRKTNNPNDPRGPLVTFRAKDFRLFEHKGPLLEDMSPLLAKRVFGSKARFVLGSLSPAELKEAKRLLHRIFKRGELDHLQLPTSTLRGRSKCRPVIHKGKYPCFHAGDAQLDGRAALCRKQCSPVISDVTANITAP